MVKKDNVSSSNKMEEYESLAKLISKGDQIPKSLLPLLLEVYQSSMELQNNDNEILIPREYELVYAEKDRKEEILSTTKAAPLQKIRTFNNGNKYIDNWENKLILGDNLKVLKSLAEDHNVRGKVNLIYIDPPFATKRDFMKDTVRAYTDRVVGAAFIEFTRKRLILMKELLAPDGIIVVHLDQKKGYYIKIILDELFSEGNFQNEIIWRYGKMSNAKKRFPQNHDTLLVYSKSETFTFNQVKDSQSEYRARFIRYLTNNKVLYRSVKTSDDKLILGRIKKVEKDLGRSIRDTDILFDFDEEFKTQDDVFYDISIIKGNAAEKVNYPTQKPEALLARIIKTYSNEGDLVMDAFAGSGTTLAIAEKFNRKWIGIDCGKLSIYTIQSRMLSIKSEVGNQGQNLKHKPFAVFNAGLYDYKAIEAMDFAAYREFILQLFQVRDKKHQINGVDVDGMIKTQSVLLWKHKDEKNLTISESYLQSLHENLGGKGGSIFYLIAPNSAFSFPEDGKLIGETEYRFLRIPQSIIDELIASNGASLVQPRSAGNINDTVEALAFDFIKTPEVKRILTIDKPKDENLLNLGSKHGLIKISKFESNGLGKPSDDDPEGLNYLAMVMIDTDYKGKIFNLCEVVFAEKIENGEVYFDLDGVGQELMVIYLDVYGNEFREVINKRDFKGLK
jgi:site-specific DNA-methyltransferase (adenine-specific)/adenine-specific DNA-methyltransferase